jgi:hypothetical protein
MASHCCDYGCLKLPDGPGGTSLNWVHDHTTWDGFLMHSRQSPNPSYFSDRRGGSTAGSGWQVLNEASLQPLCALEH